MTRVNDEEGNNIGPYRVGVNAELYQAFKEMAEEEHDAFNNLPCVVHTVFEGDNNEKIVGGFLLNNSKSFAEKLRDRAMIQDLLRYSIMATEECATEENLAFLKKSLSGFIKGTPRNVKVIMEFANLPPEYLKKFEKFMFSYEFGSLMGQKKITLRHLKTKGSRLELPIVLLKQHLKISERRRNYLIDAVLSKRLSFPAYRKNLEEVSSKHRNTATCSQEIFHDLFNRSTIIDKENVTVKDFDDLLLPGGSVFLIDLDRSASDSGKNFAVAERGFSTFLTNGGREKKVVGIFLR